MNRAITQFEINLQSARQLGVIYSAFVGQLTAAVDLDELLRAELVLAVSALDCFVHDLVRIGMGRAFDATATVPKSFIAFGVSMGFAREILAATSTADRDALADQEIRRLLGFKTFQAPDKISQALSLLGITEIWNKVGTAIGVDSVTARKQLEVIVDRRNRIAHEGDIDPTKGIGVKYTINFPMVKQAVDYLDTIAHAIQLAVVAEIAF